MSSGFKFERLGFAETYFQVGGKSFILVVQTLPLGLAEGFKRSARFVSDGCTQIADFTLGFVIGVYEGLVYQVQLLRYLFKGLPGEAYLGLGLLLCIVLVSV